MEELVKETIKIHDNYQFEIKQAYNLSLEKKATNSYFVQTYFFVPNNLNINRETYTREDFYKDLRANIRLEAPSMLLKNFCADHSLIKRLRECLVEYTSLQDRVRSSNLEYQIKMFCLIYKKSLRIQLKFLQNTSRRQDVGHLVEEYISCSQSFIGNYRELKETFAGPDMAPGLQMVYLFADEYMSLKTETHSCMLLEILKNKDPRLEKKYHTRVMKIIQHESDYRRECQYPSIPQQSGDNEIFIFRQASLKKFLSNILFLETRVERGGKYMEHVLYSLAAGIAMLFATTVAFIGQNRFGTLSLPFFIALVISYMFKDRLKELLRTYLYASLHTWLYDRQRNIFHNFHEKIGTCKESYNIIDENKVAGKILSLRGRDRIGDIDNSMIGEDIILYRKYIRFSSKKFKKINRRYSTSTIIDIMRFNIQDFLRSMDNPEKKIFIPNHHRYRKSLGMRVYHINIITHFIVDKTEYLRKFRIVLNRDGISRIEEIG